jgi:hypothetical protein
MTRRFDIGPVLVAIAAVVLLVSLFLDWYGRLTAWQAFELTDVLLAALAVASLITALGLLLPEAAYVGRRALPWLVGAAVVLVSAEIIDPPPAAFARTPQTGAWLAFGAACVMLIGAVLSLGRVSLAVAVEGRDLRRRVAAVDQRQPTTESAAVVAPQAGAAEAREQRGTRTTEPLLPRREEPGEAAGAERPPEL